MLALALPLLHCGSDAADDSLAPALDLSPKVTELVVGETAQLSVAGATGAVAWSSSDPTVATVDFGRVDAIGVGTAIIVAVSGDESARTTITVDPPAQLGLSAESATFAVVGGAPMPAAAAITITGDGGRPIDDLAVGDISYTGAASGWLTATLDGVTAPATLTLAAATDGVAPGVYGATVTLTASGASPRMLTVALFTRTATLVGDVQPALASHNCMGCHSGASASIPDFTTAATSWSTLLGSGGGVPANFCAGLLRVSPGDPASSCLYLKMSRAAAHPGPTLTGTDLTTLYAWILQGAAREP